MNKTKIPIEAMKLSPIQNRFRTNQVLPSITLPDTCGKTAAAINLRQHADGSMVAVGKPETIMTCEREIRFTDTRSDEIYFFSLKNLQLRIEAVTDHNFNLLTALPVDICTLPVELKEVAQAGEFLVLLLQDGTLYYLLYHADLHRFTALGEVPSAPEFTIEREDQPEISASVDEIYFSNTVADMRQGVPDTVQRQVDSRLRSTYSALRAAADDAGVYIQPVKVMVGLRLWDNRLLALSDAITVDGTDYQPKDRITLPLVSDEENGWSGTSATQVNVNSYRIKFNTFGLIDCSWFSVIRAVEVYVSEEPNVIDNDSTASVSYLSAQKSLGCFMPLKDEADLTDAGWRIVASLLPYEAAELTLQPRDLQAQTQPQADEFAYEADHIEGLGSFLYVSKDDLITVMHRGNPFTPAGTMLCGSKPRKMVAQPTVGGAYTRQIIYLFTDNGTMALMHDANGVPTNCRSISPETIVDDKNVCTTDQAVWAMSEQGSLIKFTDTHAEVILRNMRHAYMLAWHKDMNELWLVPQNQSHSIVVMLSDIKAGKPVPAFMSTFVPADVLPAGGEGLFADKKEISRASDFTPQDEDEMTDVFYATVPYRFDDGGMSLFSVGLVGAADVCISVSRESGACLAKNRYEGKEFGLEFDSGVTFMLPDVKHLLIGYPTGVCFSVEGKFLQLTKMEMITTDSK